VTWMQKVKLPKISFATSSSSSCDMDAESQAPQNQLCNFIIQLLATQINTWLYY